MSILLVVIKGPREGDRFKARPGLHIGRSKADINLRDPKASSLHAAIQEGADGKLMLVDLGSTNGIRVQSGKVKEIELKPGQRFSIGNTTIEVQGEVKKEKPEDAIEEWRKILLRTVSRASPKPSSDTGRILPFPIPVEVEVRSPLMHEKFLFGYGPRKIGPHSLDLPLEGENLPTICFELHPEGEVSVLFKTDHPDVVLLNGTSTASDILNDGDIISVQDTQMRVRFKP